MSHLKGALRGTENMLKSRRLNGIQISTGATSGCWLGYAQRTFRPLQLKQAPLRRVTLRPFLPSIAMILFEFISNVGTLYNSRRKALLISSGHGFRVKVMPGKIVEGTERCDKVHITTHCMKASAELSCIYLLTCPTGTLQSCSSLPYCLDSIHFFMHTVISPAFCCGDNPQSTS